ncbi:MAG: ATP-binding protein, partial [Alistipes sp.]|nr:ATP-binding protein [Alistipes sp.]
MALKERFKEYVASQSLISDGRKYLLAVSGGVDSMVLMHLFKECGYDFGVAHCNFQLRGRESEEDEQMVLREAERYGVAIYNKRFDTEREMELSGESMEMVARRQRYEWFEELCREYQAQSSETANKNDLTALFNIGYGLYVVTSNDGKKDNGLIVNT